MLLVLNYCEFCLGNVSNQSIEDDLVLKDNNYGINNFFGENKLSELINDDEMIDEDKAKDFGYIKTKHSNTPLILTRQYIFDSNLPLEESQRQLIQPQQQFEPLINEQQNLQQLNKRQFNEHSNVPLNDDKLNRDFEPKFAEQQQQTFWSEPGLVFEKSHMVKSNKNTDNYFDGVNKLNMIKDLNIIKDLNMVKNLDSINSQLPWITNPKQIFNVLNNKPNKSNTNINNINNINKKFTNNKSNLNNIKFNKSIKDTITKQMIDDLILQNNFKRESKNVESLIELLKKLLVQIERKKIQEKKKKPKQVIIEEVEIEDDDKPIDEDDNIKEENKIKVYKLKKKIVRNNKNFLKKMKNIKPNHDYDYENDDSKPSNYKDDYINLKDFRKDQRDKLRGKIGLKKDLILFKKNKHNFENDNDHDYYEDYDTEEEDESWGSARPQMNRAQRIRLTRPQGQLQPSSGSFVFRLYPNRYTNTNSNANSNRIRQKSDSDDMEIIKDQ